MLTKVVNLYRKLGSRHLIHFSELYWPGAKSITDYFSEFLIKIWLPDDKRFCLKKEAKGGH